MPCALGSLFAVPVVAVSFVHREEPTQYLYATVLVLDSKAKRARS